MPGDSFAVAGDRLFLVIHIAPTPPPRKGAASFALKPVTAREVTIVWLVTNGHVTEGVPRSERVHSLTMTPTKGFFHFTMCRGEL